jgi:hypothetical protein
MAIYASDLTHEWYGSAVVIGPVVLELFPDKALLFSRQTYIRQ